MKRSARRRGFTLVEVLAVVAIIIVMTNVAVTALERYRSHSLVRTSSSRLRMGLEHARTLSTLAGTRIGTPRLDNTCAGVPTTDQLWILVDPAGNTVTVPKTVSYDAATDVMSVGCDVIDVAGPTGSATMDAPVGATAFAFGATARVFTAAGSTDIYMHIKHATVTAPGEGIRVLASGIVCSAATPTVCDEDR